MKLLALESSCDETSAAVIEDGYIVSNIISSQIELHAQYGGVVPELATREHLRNVPIVVREALNKACGKKVFAISGFAGIGLTPLLRETASFIHREKKISLPDDENGTDEENRKENIDKEN